MQNLSKLEFVRLEIIKKFELQKAAESRKKPRFEN